jgi:hypothetical protein
MASTPRRTAMKVQFGRVQKKNNWKLDRGDYYALKQDEIRIDRRAPGRGHRHLITIAQLRTFLSFLPDWEEAAIGLDAIVLDRGHAVRMGICRPGVVEICAWNQQLWWHDLDPWFEAEHAHILDLLEVERVKRGYRVEARWTANQARAFQLLHILPHELGHHHDRMTNRSQLRLPRGEPYAEHYANVALEQIWPAYGRHFDL